MVGTISCRCLLDGRPIRNTHLDRVLKPQRKFPMGSLPERMSIKVRVQEPGEIREQELLRRVQAGQKELFYELIKPYERRVYAASFAVPRNEAEADDAA